MEDRGLKKPNPASYLLDWTVTPTPFTWVWEGDSAEIARPEKIKETECLRVDADSVDS